MQSQNPSVQQWVEKAAYDLETAQAMLNSSRYVYVVFCCQQAVEKMIKAIIAHVTDELPPRIHNLIRLSERAGLQPDAEQARLMRELSELYVQSRYPEQIESISSSAWQVVARDALPRTEKLVRWLSSMI